MARPLIFLLATMTLAGCLVDCGGAPSRPASVSSEALWGGDAKKGVFLKVNGHQGTLWQLEVWNRKGQLLGAGGFRLRGFGKARIIPDEIIGWENGALHLKDGTWLVPEPAASH
ncbi:hypothetical protein [Geothrix sp. PMB-07]|uniref:hypothetical protein n=1 Tax=Geothrix sp. PMB-07 TaxID=3068640 RepID=UPI00274234CF|nr:hypothetical protein [Geothrix sp. PMB-07]WLT33046.1 hypothetical protein Q9293_06885 [Geothrix sp. PMB-07]